MTTITFNLPILPDNGVWWLNYAAWVSYWGNGTVTANIANATTTDAGAVLQAATTIFAPTNDVVDLIIDGNNVNIPTNDAFQALLTDYLALKAALKAAGVINNA